jgi:hypothetical protein
MPTPYHPVDTQHVLHLLRQWLKTAAPPEGVDWLDRMRDAVNDGADDGAFHAIFAAAPRHVGRTPLHLRPDDRAEAERARPGWRPQAWTADQAARTVLLLVYDDSDAPAYGAMLADVTARGRTEAMAVYRALPLLPYPERHAALAAEAIRADDTALFEALALHNPYPADALDDPAWNRLVMRAVFLDAPLDAIAGLERRANPVLAHEIRDYARLRRAAGHAVPPTLWRAVGPHAAGHLVDELAAMLDGPDVDGALAAALVLSHSRDPKAAAALSRRPDLADALKTGRLTWDRLSVHRLRKVG